MNNIILQWHKNGSLTAMQLNESAEILTSQEYLRLADVPASEKGANIIVIVPGEDVLLIQTKIPKTNRHELLKAIPFALEEQLATDVEQLYFALGDYDALDQLTVAVTDNKLFETKLNELQRCNIHTDVALPDYLAIPYEDKAWTVYVEERRALVRTGKQAGFTTDRANLAMVLALTLKRTINAPHEIRITTNANDIEPSEFDPLKEKIALNFVAAGSKWAVKELLAQPAINLLQGKYRAKNKSSKAKTYWKMAGIACAAWLAVLFGTQLTALIYFNIHSHKLEKNIAMVYRQIFPGSTDVIEPRFRIKRQLTNLSRSSHGSYFTQLLSRAAVALHHNSAIQLQSINYEAKQLTLQLRADTLAALEIFTRKLTQQGLSVKQKQVDTSGKRVNAAITIKRQTT